MSPAAKCADAVPNAGITYDVLLICVFVSIFLLPVWRMFKEWLAMQKVYNRYITAASDIAHPRELSQSWVRVDSMSSISSGKSPSFKFNSRSNLSIDTNNIDKANTHDDNTANEEYRDVEEEEDKVAMKESKFNQSRSRMETSRSKNSRSEQKGVEMSIVKSDQTDDVYL
jgi:hypothetical protein